VASRIHKPGGRTLRAIELVIVRAFNHGVNQLYMPLNPEIGNHPIGNLFIGGNEKSYPSDTQAQWSVNAIGTDHFFLRVIEQRERQVVLVAKTIVTGLPLGTYTNDISTHSSNVVVAITNFTGFRRTHRRKIRWIEIQNQ
jgi:hypothetical protein